MAENERQSFGEKLYQHFKIVPIALVAIICVETAENYTHSRFWKTGKATVTSINLVCRFHKHYWWRKNGSFAEEYCAEGNAIAQRIRDGWSPEPDRLRKEEIGLIFTTEQNELIRTTTEPWLSDVPPTVQMGRKIEIRYSGSSPTNVELAGAPEKNLTEALQGLLFVVALSGALYGWRYLVLRQKRIEDGRPVDS